MIDLESLAYEISKLNESHVDLFLPSQAKIVQGIWKYQQFTKFNWLDFYFYLGRVFCKVCKENGGYSVSTK